MYLTDPPNDVVAIDARTGRVFWRYRHPLPAGVAPCCGRVNRGLAMLGNTLYMGTLDARLVALDASTGRKRWDVAVADYEKGYSLTLAPLAIGDKILVGPAGGELGIRGFIAAYDANNGKELWRFQTIPGPGEPGHETWTGDAWQHGGLRSGSPARMIPQLNLTYWGIGNPGPDWNPELRHGDNLYSDSVVALDADTGKLKWHFQFSPHDGFDYDSVQIPVLVDLNWKASRGRRCCGGTATASSTCWIGAAGSFCSATRSSSRHGPRASTSEVVRSRLKERMPSAEGSLTYPGVQGGTNWYAPSFSPATGLFYLTAWEDYPGVYYSWDQKYEAGKWFSGGSVRAELPAIMRQEVRTIGPESGYGTIRALDPQRAGASGNIA